MEKNRSELGQVVRLFLKLGITGFGGPAAHIAMMQDEVVVRRGWLTREQFLDLIGATNLIPGPNSTEMAIHVGYLRAGWAGLVAAGASFILPAAAITLVFAWLYVRFGSLPEVTPFLSGVQPAVLAIIAVAVWRLGRTAVKGWPLAVVGGAVAAASLLGVNEVLALFAGGIGGAVWLRLQQSRERPGGPQAGAAAVGAAGLKPAGAALAGAGGLAAAGAVSLWKLGLGFLAIGSVMYGTGYVLVAFLEGWLVQDTGWLTSRQLVDAIAVGQFTPGPLLSTATFIGYLLGGLPGAAVSTAGVFLPSFVLVVLLARLMPYLRRLAWTGAFLDAVNAAAIGLMAAVAIHLGQVVLTTWPAWLIGGVVLLLTLRWKIATPWLVVGGAVAGWLIHVAVS